MADTKVTAPGTFCWSEIGTIDGPAAKRFYEALFGWEMQDSPIEDVGVYTMLRVRGRELGGLYELPPAQREQGVPPHWLGYIRVTNVDEACTRVPTLGGTVVMGPIDVMEFGRMAVLQDPTGGAFAIWQDKAEGGERAEGAGTPCWYELVTNDRAEATAFYAALLGWKLETWDGEADYVLFRNGEAPVAGAATASEGVPSHWLTYVAVDDVDETTARATANGGRVVQEPHDIPGVGRSGLLADHAGAIFGIIRFDAPSK